MSKRRNGLIFGFTFLVVGLILIGLSSYGAFQGTTAPAPGGVEAPAASGTQLTPYLGWIGLASAAVGLVKVLFETARTVRDFFAHSPAPKP